MSESSLSEHSLKKYSKPTLKKYGENLSAREVEEIRFAGEEIPWKEIGGKGLARALNCIIKWSKPDNMVTPHELTKWYDKLTQVGFTVTATEDENGRVTGIQEIIPPDRESVDLRIGFADSSGMPDDADKGARVWLRRRQLPNKRGVVQTSDEDPVIFEVNDNAKQESDRVPHIEKRLVALQKELVKAGLPVKKQIFSSVIDPYIPAAV